MYMYTISTDCMHMYMHSQINVHCLACTHTHMPCCCWSGCHAYLEKHGHHKTTIDNEIKVQESAYRALKLRVRDCNI